MRRRLDNGMGGRLRKIREDLGLSREELAEQIQISPRYLAEIENGAKSMSAMTIYKACENLSISADYLLMGRTETADASSITAMLSKLDEKYVGLAEDMLKAFILAIGRSKAD
ncbi:MAG: helix-turn-helix transcriptional regulator [Eubacteriales bacterium]